MTAERESKKNEPAIAAHSPAETYIDRSDGEEIALWPMIMKLWNSRRMIGLALGCALLVFLLGLIFVYVWFPDQKIAQVGFHLLFEGAEKGEYPNGMLFGPTDITSDQVANKVYAANNLSQYGKFADFKKSLFVQQDNRRLESLEAEFRGKLADAKLTPVDRQRLEREFAAQSINMASADFKLVFVRRERFRKMPETLVYKILNDILIAYAEDADKVKGALKYRISVPTRNILRRDIIDEEDYIISLDMIRTAIQRVQTALTAIKPIPGADIVRVGTTSFGLVDLQSSLEDLTKFRLNPLISLVRATGASKNAALAVQYLRNQQVMLNLDREAAERTVKVYDDNLRKYLQQRSSVSSESAGSGAQPSGLGGMGNVPALIPQLGDSFFDRLIELGQKGEDTVYRQDMVNKSIESGMDLVEIEKEVAYYKDLISIFENASKRIDSVVQKDFLSIFQAKYTKILDELLVTIDSLNLFYDTLSQRNLNPATELIRVTIPPSISTESSVSGKRVRLAAILYFFVVIIGIAVVIFFRDKSREAPAES